MIDYKNQENLLLDSLYRALRRANYWTETIAKAQNKKQVEVWSRIEDEAYAHVRNTLFLLEWNEEKQYTLYLQQILEDREKEECPDLPDVDVPELDIIVSEPKTTTMLVPSGYHRSFGGVLIKDGE